MYHVKQPEPVAQMDTQYPPRRPISHLHQEQQQMHKPQSEAPARHGSLENGGRREEN
ncbi:hypothetical protein AGABI2DRAFT_136444 [Agaricus bisporus var. bisporus H97]|uniref:hypothetical protein n=1 Tax=Agaricus bisporus var. bisporus (strain H97 / ATCC MYA-4626 / FGSC 10389) TaxID=936046 RepID=UPI00029F5F2E|nr:hypothetical protein AGABI2DRAFT_136444 [Agaricus bisporus var. bisporus H97]EKV47774.1 hypothetical protein AGABI2DRAFT_136444 [Agaricus bisporus var. bisporus H97]